MVNTIQSFRPTPYVSNTRFWPNTTQHSHCRPINCPRYTPTHQTAYTLPAEMNDPQDEALSDLQWYRIWFPPIEDTYFGQKQRLRYPRR